MKIICVCKDGTSFEAPFSVKEEGSAATYTVKQADITGKNIERMSVEYEGFVNECKNGYMFYPVDCGNGVVMTEFKERADKEWRTLITSMAIAGVGECENAAYFQAITMAYDLAYYIAVLNNVYYMKPEIRLEGDDPEEDFVFMIKKMPNASYSDMGREYRKYLLAHGCVPIKERMKGRPALAYAADSTEFRIRMGWKPVPTPVMHQNDENEPPLLVKVDIKKLNELVDKMHEAGVGKTEICLVGWGKGGHDGRFPQQIPVAPEYGTDDELKAFIKKAQGYGYQVVAHTNSVCAYEVADNWDPDLTTKKLVDGKPEPMMRMGYVNSGGLSGGAPYHVCAKTAYEVYGKTDLPKVAEYGFSGLHFIDELTACMPEKCYDEKHGISRREAWEYNRKLATLSKELFGGFQSEAWYDYMNKDVDYIMYTSFRFEVEPTENMPLFDRDIPLWQILYHGIVLSNPSSHTVNYNLKGKKYFLKMLEQGGRPLMYLYSKFGDKKNWMGDIDLYCATEEEMDACINAMKEASKFVEDYGYLQYEFMDSHKKLADGVFETVYSDGTVITVDYNNETYDIKRG